MSERTPPSAGAPADDAGAPPTPAHARPGDDAQARRERLKAVYLEARGCERCPQLVSARTQVVFGGGNADADLMLVGEAPGAREDEQGTPFVGASGKLLDELLASAGLARADVFIANALKCRPPGNRDPTPAEIERCRPYLEEQVALVQPRVIVTLGNFATRLLRGDSTGISDLHGRAEIREVAGRAVYLMPLFHPAAALYTRWLLDTLREDFARLPELVARPALPQPEVVELTDELVEPAVAVEPESVDVPEVVAGGEGTRAAPKGAVTAVPRLHDEADRAGASADEVAQPAGAQLAVSTGESSSESQPPDRVAEAASPTKAPAPLEADTPPDQLDLFE